MYQVDKIIESQTAIEKEIADLEKEIADMRNEILDREKKLAEKAAFLPGLIKAKDLLSSNLPKNEPIIPYRAKNNVMKAYSSYNN